MKLEKKSKSKSQLTKIKSSELKREVSCKKESKEGMVKYGYMKENIYKAMGSRSQPLVR